MKRIWVPVCLFLVMFIVSCDEKDIEKLQGLLAIENRIDITCSSYGRGTQVGTIYAGLSEISGIAPSRDQLDVLWVHEDSGNTPYLYAINPQGKSLGKWKISSADRFYDWEDIAIQSIENSPDIIWIGDIGDNAARDADITWGPRKSIRVLQVEEPEVDTTKDSASKSIYALKSFKFTYPDKPHDAEALAVDSSTGDLYIFTKEQNSSARVFRMQAPIQDGTLEQIATIDMSLIDGADFSPNGRELLVRNYSSARYWNRLEDGTWKQTLKKQPTKVRLKGERQGESIGFEGEASGFYTVSEGEGVPIWFYAKSCL